MTILSPETLENVLDLIGDGATVVEVTAAVGLAPKSKSIFGWLRDSEDAAEFGVLPDPENRWCLTRGDRCEFFHILFAEAKEAGRVARAGRVSPLRADLEARLAQKREKIAVHVAPTMVEQQAPPRVIVERATRAPVIPDPPPPPPKPRPSYALRRAPPLDTQNREAPSEGRFSMTHDRPKSEAQRKAGTVEFDGIGVKRW